MINVAQVKDVKKAMVNILQPELTIGHNTIATLYCVRFIIHSFATFKNYLLLQPAT